MSDRPLAIGTILRGRYALALAAGGVVAAALLLWPDEAYDPDSFMRGDEAGFVVTDISYVLGPAAQETGACPRGMSKNLATIFQETPEGQRRPGESDEDYSKRIEAGGQALSMLANGKNACLNPELTSPDPHYRTLDAKDVPLGGLDIDGKDSPSDFMSPSGRRGIDNQFYRAVGCNTSFQPNGQSNGFREGLYVGEWGILIRLSDIDNLENDDHVKVGIFASADPLALSPTREALEYATYALDQDPRFRAVANGRIKDGILLTERTDVRFHSVVNAMHLERPLHDARIVARVSPDGTLNGFLAGYTPVEELYDFQFGYRNAKDGAGKPSPMQRRLGSSNGAARVLGHTCSGVWHALHRMADGDRDPESGKFTSISTQYRFKAVKAFLVDVETESSNDTLVGEKET